MVSADDEKAVSMLTKLLRAEIREARFSLTHLAPADAEVVPSPFGKLVQTKSQNKISKKELDARGLKALHDAGAWKRELFQFDIRVDVLRRGLHHSTRRTEFNCVLDDLGIRSDDHVAHALGPLLRGYSHSSGKRDFPHKSITVSETAELWKYLLVDACLGTPRRTATKVLGWARGAHLAFETRVLLGRLCAASSFTLASGFAVERLPRKSMHLDYRLQPGFGTALTDYLDRTLLRIPCTVAPVLSKPTKVIDQQGDIPVVSWNSSANVETTWQLPLGGVQELTRALSLVCNVAVETPMIWTDYSDHAHFGRPYGTFNAGGGEPTPRSATEITLTAELLKEAIRLQPALSNAPASIETALQYWLKSKSRRPDDADRLVFLRTALEALFLDRGNRAELTFRLATNGAWYTGRNREERRQRYNVLKNVYGAASGAVHAGCVNSAGVALLNDGQEVCRLAILKRLRSKQDPVWEDIVFGR